VQLVIGVIDAGAIDQGNPRVAILEDRAVGGDLAQRVNEGAEDLGRRPGFGQQLPAFVLGW
jgi:hypothetical protein